LLVAIFREVIRNSKFDKWNPSTLASVCSFWKSVALLTPEFWTRITILIDLPYFSASSIASALARSRKLILEEVIITRNDWTATNDEREMAESCRSCKSSIPTFTVVALFPSMFCSALPSLRSLVISTALHNS
jgi:hypothetical protein